VERTRKFSYICLIRKLVLGVVNNPLTGHLYSAVKGRGAFCNGRKLSVSGVKELSSAMILMEIPAGANREKKDAASENLKTLMEKAHAVRCPGE